MNFKITKDKYMPIKRYVWCNGLCIGYFTSQVREHKDIDWAKYRADKTLRMGIGERWYTEFFPVAYPNASCQKCSSEKEAILAILAKHNESFANIEECKQITIGL